MEGAVLREPAVPAPPYYDGLTFVSVREREKARERLSPRDRRRRRPARPPALTDASG